LGHVDRTQQRGIGKAEHRRVGADAEREREHGGEGETGLLDQKTGGIAHVAGDILHDASSRTMDGFGTKAEPLSGARMNEIQQEPAVGDVAPRRRRARELQELVPMRPAK
jgi:hypothetical protein